MLHRPRFKPHYRVELSENGVFLFSESDTVVLDGRLHRLVAPLIDGRRTADEIVREVADDTSAADVYYTLTRLEQRGHITESCEALPAGEEALWSIQGVDAARAAERPGPGLRLRPGDRLARGRAARAALLSARVRTSRERCRPGEADLLVVVTDDYLSRALLRVNQEALRSGAPWMLVRPTGAEIWVGPVLRPGTTGCFECLSFRLQSSRAAECYERERQGWPEPFTVARAQTPVTLQIAYGVAATEIAGWIARGGASPLEGRLLSLDVRTWEARPHALIRRPQCPACGDPTPRPSRRIELASAPYLSAQDGGCRVVSAEVTMRRYEHHVSPIIGTLAGIERIGPVSDGVSHVFVAGSNSSRRGNASFAVVRHDLRNKNSGKGTSELSARVSALCEGLERYSGIFMGDEPRRKARMRELGDGAVHPNDCMLFSDRQFATRDAWNGRTWRLDYVPLPFDPDDEIEWTPVWSLTRKGFRFLPTAYCYFAYPFPGQRPYCVACSSGNAAGNTIEEAILQGFFELMERDAVAAWWYSRVRRPAVDLASFDEPFIRRIEAVYAARGRELWVLDLTNDLGIPVLAALSRRKDEAPERILMGFGAHLDPRVALLRAVTELNQMLAMFVPGLRRRAAAGERRRSAHRAVDEDGDARR